MITRWLVYLGLAVVVIPMVVFLLVVGLAVVYLLIGACLAVF